ncbi:hypothetical protein [Timonella senegalensis]|uniref:hypothetical protein n=1 Tax=Timonella senegalensis TaxID=1465825 RepID=UPI0028AB1750|nr:hypothetical protein [Timonella senegalensis]
MTEQTFSRNKIRTAGSKLRKYGRGEATVEERDAALDTIQAYRATFALPMGEVNNILHAIAFVILDDDEIRPVSRLKQITTIEDKVKREARLDLSTMQDIGGCRVVVETTEMCYRILDGVLKEWPDGKVYDYIKAPRSSGYRAIHVVVVAGGCPIEIQIRSTPHHEWAQTVESISKALEINYKFDGSHPVQQMLKYQANIEEDRRNGREPHAADIETWDTLREEVIALIREQINALNHG